MQRTRKPTVAGILCIIAGGLSVVCLILWTLLLLVAGLMFIMSANPGEDPGIGAHIGRAWILGIIAVMIAIPGGIYALRRRKWGLALAGSIAVVGFGAYGILLPVFPGELLVGLGILAIIFVSLSKSEFKSGTRAARELAGDTGDT